MCTCTAVIVNALYAHRGIAGLIIFPVLHLLDASTYFSSGDVSGCDPYIA